MRGKPWRCGATLLAIVGLLFAGGCTAPAGTTGQRDPARAWQTVRIGLCEDYPEESRALSAARRDLDLARATGARVLRIAFGWDAMEPRRGVYDWTFWDEFVAAAGSAGITLIPYVCYTPKWAATDQGENFWRSPPHDVADFARFMRAIVSRYRDITTWELWNEPDNPAYWSGSVRDFAELLRAGSAAVRAADPGDAVVLGGIATELIFLERLFREERIAPAVDIVNLHSYYETWHPDPIERLPEYIGEAAEIVAAHGEREPLWLAETGYSSVGARPEISAVYRARYRGEHSAEAQAAALVRTAVLAITSGRIETFAWYRINDLVPLQEVIGDDNNRHLGIRTAAGAPKPAEVAFKLVAGWFAQPVRSLPVTLDSVGAPDGRAQVHGFELRDGRRIVFAWLGMPPSSQEPRVAPVTDPRRATVSVTIAGPPPRAVQVVDARGERRSEALAWRADASGLELDIALAGLDVIACVLEP